MAFEPIQPQTPTDVGDIWIQLGNLVDPEPEESEHVAQYEVQILDQNGEVMQFRRGNPRGNLIPHISAEWRQTLLDFMAYVRAEAYAGFISQ